MQKTDLLIQTKMRLVHQAADYPPYIPQLSYVLPLNLEINPELYPLADVELVTTR